MRTPNDHQSAAVLWPLRFTTSGAMYSTVPQNEYVFFSSNIDSLLKPKSVSLMWPSWSSRMLQWTFCQSVTSNRDQDTNEGPLCLWGTVLNYIPVIHSLSQQCCDGNEHWNVWKQILSDIHVVVIEKFVINTFSIKNIDKKENQCVQHKYFDKNWIFNKNTVYPYNKLIKLFHIFWTSFLHHKYI